MAKVLQSIVLLFACTCMLMQNADGRRFYMTTVTDGPSTRRRFFMTGDPANNKGGEVGSKFKHDPLPFTKDQPSNDDIIELGGKRWRLLPMTKGEKDNDEVGKSRWRLLPMAKNEPDPDVGTVMEVGGLVWFAPVSPL